MSMSTHVVGFRPADEKWHQMLAVWRACAAADVRMPREVEGFFNGENPENEPGMEVDISAAMSAYEQPGADGFDVDLTKLPADIRVVRFYNSW
jgi:hypothetical protein